MARHLIHLLAVIASFSLVAAQGDAEGKQLTGEESFCAKLEAECPEYLVKGVVCASTAVDYPSECEFWRENCRRKSIQRMTLVARSKCTDTYCPANCRGEIRAPVCANFLNAMGILREKDYRNYCKYREAKCKQRNVFGIDLNLLYYGECGAPIGTLAPRATTTVQPSLTETTTQMPDDFDENATYIVMETFATEIVTGTMATEVIEGTVLSTEEFDGTPSNITSAPDEEFEGTLIPEELVATTLVYEEEETLGTDITMEGTMAPEDQTEELGLTTIELDVTDLADDEATTPEELTGTPTPEELTGTPSLEELTGTPSPDEIMETTIVLEPETTGEMLSTSSPEETTSPEEEMIATTAATSLHQQCLDEYQICIDGVSASKVQDIILSFFDCLENFQICVGEDPLNVEPNEQPPLGPS
ncbi:uncharacterized protein [Amphiura filiformis]|uniref:uncharacterized protein n=1 Tax=Amphiura filiformis TaxID=82378 RepID=UPI003B21DCC7